MNWIFSIQFKWLQAVVGDMGDFAFAMLMAMIA